MARLMSPQGSGFRPELLSRITTPQPPSHEGKWTLLQQRYDRALWQWDRSLSASHYGVTRYVILREANRFEFDDCGEAENLFHQMDG